MAFDRPPAVPTPLGKYEFLHEQAGSGIGSTWIARAPGDTGIGSPLYTVLRIPRSALVCPEAADAVVVEARRAASLRHPCVLALIDVGATDAEVFAVSEHVEGETLAALLAASGGADAMSVSVALRILLDVLEALAAAHALAPPLVHGELTPQLVRVGLDGVTRVGGFGLMPALARAGWAGARGVERLAYAAPERVKEMGAPGPALAPVDGRADLFSVGVMLWEAASHKRLFAAKIEAAVIQRVLTAPIPPLSSASSGTAPPELDALVQWALERNPDRRVGFAAEVVSALEGLPPSRLASRAEVAALVQNVTGKSASSIGETAPALNRSVTPVPPPPARPVPMRKSTLLGGVSAPPAVFGAPPAAAAVKPKVVAKAPEIEDDGWDVDAENTSVPVATSVVAAKAPEPVKAAEPVRPVAATVKVSEPAKPVAATAKAPERSKTPAPMKAPVRSITPSTLVTAATSTTPARPDMTSPGVRPPIAALPLGMPGPESAAKASLAVKPAAAPEPVAAAPEPVAAAPATATPEPGVRAKPGARLPPAPRPLGGKPGSTAVVSSGDAAAAGSASFTARSFGQGKRPSVEPKVVIGSHLPPPPLQPGETPALHRAVAPSPVAALPPPPPQEEPSVDSRRGRNATELDKLGVGSTLGRYEILMPVARGGMASVWAARIQGSRGFQQIVAIKTMLPDVSDDPEFESMFLDEGRVAARIRHPNVAEILDIGEQDEVLYLVMEWVDGENLSTLLRAARNVGGVPLPIALRIASHTCAGLHAAHELRDDAGNLVDLIHRDVSPANVLVSTAGFVKLVDFGVAKSKNRLHQTRAGGMVKGKTPYLSPEQLGQLPIDRRSDIFSFGALLYVLLTGLHPFRGDSESKTIENIALRDPVSMRSIMPTIPAELEKVVAKALEKDPNKRFSTAAELQRALDTVATSLGVFVTDQDVAAFIDRVIGEPLAKRTHDLQRSITSLDAEGGRPDAAHPPVPAVFPGTPFAPAKPIVLEAPLPLPGGDRPTLPEPSAARPFGAAAPEAPPARALIPSIVDEVSFEEIPEPMDPQLAAAVVPVPNPGQPEPSPFAALRAPASPLPELVLVTSEVRPDATSIDTGTDDEEMFALPPQRRSKLKLVVGGVLGACVLLGALAVVGSTGKNGLSGKAVTNGSAAVTESTHPAATTELPAHVESPPPAATPEPAAAAPEPEPRRPVATAAPTAAAPPPKPAPAQSALPEPVEPPPAPGKPTPRPAPKPLPTGKGTSKPPKKYNPTGI
jgi:eukaryotic-like serine/threonine-protein kinase